MVQVIHVFDLKDMSCSASCHGHRDTVLCLDAAFNTRPAARPDQPGTGILVSGGKDNEVRVWEMPTGRCIGQGVGHVGSVGAVALARKNPSKFMVSAGADKLLKVRVRERERERRLALVLCIGHPIAATS